MDEEHPQITQIPARRPRGNWQWDLTAKPGCALTSLRNMGSIPRDSASL